MANKIEGGDYTIHYRLPSVTESLRLLGGIGIDPSNPDMEGLNQLVVMADMIDCSEKFVEKIEKKGKEVKWSEAIMDKEFSQCVSNYAATLMNPEAEDNTESKKS